MMELTRRRHRRRPETVDLQLLPERCRPFAEAIMTGGPETDAASDLGAAYAAQGEGLDMCLADLDEIYLCIDGEVAPLAVVRIAALAWGEATQAHYNRLSCADPLTGLTSIHHLQSGLASLYGGAETGWCLTDDVSSTHALLVVDVVVEPRQPRAFHELEAALRQAAAIEVIREAVVGAGEPARLSPHRIGALVRRTRELHRQVAQMADALELRLMLAPSGGRVQAWIEALPDGAHAGRRLVDELAR